MADIAIVGPGAVGGFFAAHLAGIGCDVVSCARRPFDRYVVTSSIAPVEAPAWAVTHPSELDGIDPVDWVLVGVKAHQTQDAAPWFDRLCGPSTSVVVMQNGVEGEERLRPYAHGADVVAAVVYCGAELTAPGRIRHTNAGTLIVPAGRAVSERLAGLFAGSGARIKLSDDYVTEAWRKLGINVLANGITALTRQPMGVLRRPEVARLAERLLDECWTVARAVGASLSTDDVTQVMEGVARMPVDGATSMYYDRMAGRPTEHDALYGAVVRAGARHGIPTPFAETVAALLAGGDEADGIVG
jgi:2-dehydropantoate 2-reductase